MMRKFINLLILIFFTLSIETAIAEPTHKGVRDAIQLYIDGSSYSKADVITQAFHPQATLYLTARDGFDRFSPAEYADFFAHRKAGEFNGRVGKILSIEVVNDIAMAKASIEIAERDLFYIDLFLLKKDEEKWQIVSKTATRVVKENKQKQH